MSSWKYHASAYEDGEYFVMNYTDSVQYPKFLVEMLGPPIDSVSCMEFYDDGTYLAPSGDKKPWKLSTGKITFENDGYKRSFSMKILAEGDTMCLTNQNGDVKHFYSVCK